MCKMKSIIGKIKNRASGKKRRGAAIVMALVTMLLLFVLGLAVITLSYSSIRMNTADDINNKAYYAAEAGVKSAVEQIRYEVSNYYNSMLSSSGSAYSTLYTNFFTNIKNNAEAHFSEPSISGFTTSTTFSLGTYNASDNTTVFNVSTTSTAADGSRYKVNGSIKVKRVDVSAGSGEWFVGNSAILAGGTLNLGNTNGMNVSGGNVEVAGIVRKNTWQLGTGSYQLIINPTVGQTISNPLKYPSYTTPSFSNPTHYITQNNYVWSTNASNVCITTADGISMTIKSCNITGGSSVYVKGNLTIESGNYYADVYCDGSLTVRNCNLYGKTYCRGNLSISSGSFAGEVRCDGSINMTNGSFSVPTYAGGSININSASAIGSLFAAGNISVSNASLSSGVIYSRTGITLGSMSATGVFYSGGDITITGGGSISGKLIAKNNIGFDSDSNKWLTLSYSKSQMDSIAADPANSFFFSSSAPTLNQSVFSDENYSASGRIN